MDENVLVIGAGPYGLAAGALLRRAGVSVRVHGAPMSFWRSMPAGMLLRSNWGATSIAELHGELSLDAYVAETRASFGAPVPLGRFVEYGDWVQRKGVPDVDVRFVGTVELGRGGFVARLEDGTEIQCRRVVVAGGIAPFARKPPMFDHLPSSLVTHTSDHDDLSVFSGRRVAVIGGGQSALESAALLHEGGASVEVIARRHDIVWLRGVGVRRRLGRLGPVLYAPTDVGPLWYSRLVALPGLFRQLPRNLQDRIAARSIRPAGSHWVRERLGGVTLTLGHTVVGVAPTGDGLGLELDNGEAREVDHLLLGTGFAVDVTRYPFLPATVVCRVDRVRGYPVLAAGFESSVPGLHFIGAPAAWSFGPVMRFVSGTWYTSRALVRHLVAARR